MVTRKRDGCTVSRCRFSGRCRVGPDPASLHGYSLPLPRGRVAGQRQGESAPQSGSNTASVLINTPGLCTVQDVEGQTLLAARRTLARAHCRVGKIRRVYSRAKRGRVISQKPRFGTVLRNGGKVNLVVSRGRKP